jgi:signal transduction histidine kinase
MIDSGHPNAPAPIGSFVHRRTLWACAAAWTLLAGCGLWWLCQANSGPSMWIIREPGPDRPAQTRRFRANYRADLGIQRVYAWILLGPYIALVALGWPLERDRMRVHLPWNLAACAAFLAACHAISARMGPANANVVIVTSNHSIVGSPTGRGTNRDELPDPNLKELFSTLPEDLRPPWPGRAGSKWNFFSSLLDFLAYAAILGGTHSIHFYRKFREREHRALLLESSLANARLSTLRAQLHPHFLFNSLNAIATLLRRDARLAESVLTSLSELLRLSLSQSDKQEVLFRDELNLVQHYLEIQATRFGDRLCWDQQVDPETLDCLVPALLLQPLVENALRHGIEPSDNPGRVRITAQRANDSLVVTVEDDGVGLSEAALDSSEMSLDGDGKPIPQPFPSRSAAPPLNRAKAGTGIGLRNLRDRLETLYGTRQRLELIPRPKGGAVVRIQVPWHCVAASSTPTRLPRS